MKSFFKILFAPVLFLFQGCVQLGEPVNKELSYNHYYDNSKSDVSYSPAGNWFELGNTPLNADVKSFTVLNSHLAKDRTRIYYEANAVKNINIDLATFSAKQGIYMGNIGMDKYKVYVFKTEYRNGKSQAIAKEIPLADPSTYEAYDLNWGKDNKNYFYRYKRANVDYSSFKNLNGYFSLDKSHVYYHYTDFLSHCEADPKTFTIFEKSLYAKDKSHVYYFYFPKDENDGHRLIRIPYEKDAEVVLYNSHYIKIGSKVYYDAIEIKEANTDTFTVITEAYAKDNNTVYFETQTITDADMATFRYDEKSYSVMDKNGKYRNGTLITEKE